MTDIFPPKGASRSISGFCVSSRPIVTMSMMEKSGGAYVAGKEVTNMRQVHPKPSPPSTLLPRDYFRNADFSPAVFE